jgi:hypothetical protein
MLNNFNYTKKIISNHIYENEKEKIEKEVKSVEIWSRTPEYNQSVTSVIKKIGDTTYNGQVSLGVKKNTDNFDIAITTFSLRFEFAKNLIKKIRELGINNNILLCVNGEKNGDFDEKYRTDILNICQEYPKVYPIFFVETRGLSKMWNTCVIHAVNENILVLNDDIILDNSNIFEVVTQHINSSEYFGLSKINDTFSYFVINKKLLDELGYFDERLLGFGEEDGDITYRLIDNKGVEVYKLYANGVHNVVSNIRHEHIKPGIGKYSHFNRDFIFRKKYTSENTKSNISGMFGFPCDKVLDDKKIYPYESFFFENKNNL